MEHVQKPSRRHPARTGYDLARDLAAFSAALWAALCVASQPGGTTPAARVTACCSRGASAPASATVLDEFPVAP